MTTTRHSTAHHESPCPHPPRRAVVLGGGGVPGLAWMIGYLQGACDTGVGLADADFAVGTSAGSVAATLLLTPHRLADAFARLTDPMRLPHEAEAPHGDRGFAEALPRILPLARDEQAYARAFLDLSGTVPGIAETVRARRQTMYDRTGTVRWPERDLRITTLSSDRVERRVLTPDTEPDLVTALSASCAVPGVWPATRLSDGDTGIDAGMLSATHMELAAEAERIVVLRPVSNVQGPLRQETDVLNRAMIITPDHRNRDVQSTSDPRRIAATVGCEQATADSGQLRMYWNHSTLPDSSRTKE